METSALKRSVQVQAPQGWPGEAEAEEAIRTLLAFIGEDPDREGLRDTPRRVVNAYRELFGGYGGNPKELLGRTFEEVQGYQDIVLMRNIPFHSHCEHHMVPIVGKVHVAYLPDGCVVGLSKIARIVDLFSRRLQTQEAMTAQIADAIDKNLRPSGVAVLMEAEHMCMAMRGINKTGSSTTTIKFTGVFTAEPARQAQFMMLLSSRT